MRMTRWVLVGLIGLLVAGCASPTPAVVPTVPTRTSAPAVAPTPTSTLPPTSTLRAQPQGEAVALTSMRPVPTVTPAEAPGAVTITILYDNNEYDERLETAWGFSCLVELPPAVGEPVEPSGGRGGWKRPSSSTPAATARCCCATCARWGLTPRTWT